MSRMKKMLTIAIWLFLLGKGTVNAQNARTILQQALQAHGRTGVTDIIATGSVTRGNVTSTLNVYAKGSGVGRLENGSGPDRHVLVFSEGKSWAGKDADLRPLKLHTSQRRITLFPFLDLIAELDQPNIEITYRGIETINGAASYRISVRTRDADAAKRFLHRPLEEAADFWIDERTSLIVRSERLRTMEEDMDLRIPSILEFWDYRLVNGVVVPFRIVNTIGRPDTGVSQSTTVFTTVTINSGIPDSLFSPTR